MVKLNLNPKGVKTGDCVVRAIAYATQQSWDDVFIGLNKIAFKKKRVFNDKVVYENYLKELGWEKQKQPRKMNGFKYTVDEFCENFRGVAIVTVANHMTAIADHDVVDTWDCGHKTIGNYWIRENI